MFPSALTRSRHGHHFPVTSLADSLTLLPAPHMHDARPRTQQDMYSSDHGARVNFPLNADAMVFEPSSMSECVQVMKGHVARRWVRNRIECNMQ